MLITEKEAFSKAVQETFTMFLGCEATLVEDEGAAPDAALNEISAIVGMSGAVCGTAAISLSQKLAREITGAMLGETPKDLNSDVVDALGEIVNMVAGRARVLLGNEATNMSLPSVVIGQCRIAYGSNNERCHLRFNCAMGSIVVELALKQQKDAAAIASVTPTPVLA